MKNILLGVFILLSAIACKPNAERNDEKFLGTWKANPLQVSGLEGNYYYVVITLSDDSELPYRVTTNIYRKNDNKSEEYDSRLCKIYDGYLVSTLPPLEMLNHPFEFKINGDEFMCRGGIVPVRGKAINHQKL